MRHPARQRRLLASLAEVGQQTPIVVVEAEGQADRYVVIDGYKRIAALEQLGRDTVEVVGWPMKEAAAVLLDRSLRLSEHETALEVGWLLAELERRFSYGLDELARRFDRSVSWVSRRLALVEVLPEGIQQQVREGKILAHVALRFLVPVARQSLEDCQRMAAVFAQYHCETREGGQLYAAWRKGSPAVRKPILDDPELFFKVQRQAQEKAPAGAAAQLLRDLEMMIAIVNRAHRRLAGAAATELEDQQSKAARYQIDRIQRQLQHIDETLLPEQEHNVEPIEQRASPNTCDSYAHAFRLLFEYASVCLKLPPSQLQLEQLDAPLVVNFLNHLETSRGNGAGSRNIRLAAIKSFMHYMEYRVPSALEQIQRILAIPAKKTDTRLVRHLTAQEMQSILDAPDPTVRDGIRDRAMLHLWFCGWTACL